MAVKNQTLEYDKTIHQILLKHIEKNVLNPRKRFVQDEEDELLQSLDEKGVLNPVIVYKKKYGNKYVLLDGERRYRACLKLKFKKLPAHVLKHEPTDLENLSMMFHIHNVREEWTDFAISMSLLKIVEEMGKEIGKLTRAEKLELSRITSLSEYKINKYLRFQEYPNEVIKKFLDAEIQDQPSKGMDPDILAEMYTPIKKIEKIMPELLNDFPVTKIIDVCIEKKAKDVIQTNRDFRLLTKALEAANKGGVRPDVIKEKIIDFLNNVNVTPQEIYDETSNDFYRFREIIKKVDNLYQEINNINLRKLKIIEREMLRKELKDLMILIDSKILK